MVMANRDSFGEKVQFTTTLRLRLAQVLKTESEYTGVPINRLVEDALILYLTIHFQVSPIAGSEFGDGLTLAENCNDLAEALWEFLDVDERDEEPE